jgi:alkylhydroperoxidase/carboxymuconolactone decarboxylase family protein YurZ
MKEGIGRLAAFAGAIAVRQSTQFERLVKAAYARGSSREDLLAVVEIGSLLGGVTAPVVA